MWCWPRGKASSRWPWSMGKHRQPWGKEERVLWNTANPLRCYGLFKGFCQSINLTLKQRLIHVPLMEFPGKAQSLLWDHFRSRWTPRFEMMLDKSIEQHCHKIIFRAHLVPVYSFGENEVFDQVDNTRGTWLRWSQERLQSIMGVSLPLFHARGIFQYSFGLIPYRKPINTIGE